ncbi:hypothetical protein SDC9_69014 [bioreactor metagenome]|uniref:Uncharacterized protein n=1 Tax=bioreactor metagenome TaxID=1076179 RepID=A0A644Y336_9ZZZZ
MMLPKVPAGRSKTKRQTAGFLGLNLSEGASEGELRETKNLSARKFPALTTRLPREELSGYSSPSALYAWNGLVAVDGTSLKIDGETVATVTPGEKQFAVVNTKLCIFPDKVYLDLTNNKLVRLNAQISSKTGTTSTFTETTLTMTPDGGVPATYEYDWGIGDQSFSIYVYTGAVWTNGWTLTGGREWYMSDKEHPPVVGNILMLRNTTVGGTYILNAQTWDWGYNHIRTPYGSNNSIGYYAVVNSVTFGKGDYENYPQANISVTIVDAKAPDGSFTSLFSVGDKVNVSNRCTQKAIVSMTSNSLTFAAGTFTAGNTSSQITVSRPIPDLDYVCESKNRLWGVCKANNIIYASALGKPTRFYDYDGTSLDSYAVAVGSEGEFTAICKYDRSVLCFKENTLHRVYGDYPAEYSATERPLFGVKEGAAGTLTNIGSVLYYLGRDGVYAFSGNTPTLISGAFGEKRFSRGYAGAAGDILYMSLKDIAGRWGLYTFDTRKGIWLKEDDTFALSFATVDGKLHFIKGHEAYTYTVDGSTVAEVVTVPEGGDEVYLCDSSASIEAVEWEAELTPFMEGTLRSKSPSKLLLRCELAAGAWIMAEISCDGEPWRQIFTSANRTEPTLIIPIAPRRCDAYRLRLKGQRECVIRAIEREFRVNSERR